MKPITGETSRFDIAELKRFTDRTAAKEKFRDLLRASEEDNEEFFVLSCYGIAGSGKSRLLQACSDFINDYPDYDIDIFFAVPEDAKYELGQEILKHI